MLNWIWMGMIVVGTLVGALLGRLGGPDGVVEGVFSAIKTGVVGIVIPLSAMMMLWLGVMRLAERSGMVFSIAAFVRPLMRRLFPEVPPDHPAMSSMVMNMAANLIGLGNAATPLGLKAMQHLEELNPRKGTATNSMCTFLAINTSSVTLVPATAIGLLAAQGIAEPYAIVGTTIGATLCSTLVAILAVRAFERMPVFNRPPAPGTEEAAASAGAEAGVDGSGTSGGGAEPDASDGEEGAGRPDDPARRPLSTRAKALLALVAALFLGIVAMESTPGLRPAVQEALGVAALAAELGGETAEAAEAAATAATAEAAEAAEPEPADDPAWRRIVSAVSLVAIPFILVFFVLYAALKRVPVYEEFVEGAKEGWHVAVRIMPFIVAMLAALAILRNSGTLAILQNLLRPALEFVRFPVDLVPMALMRPLSGSGSQGVLVEILTNEGLSEAIKYTAATMYGSTETTFYVLAVYFGSVAVRRTRHALAAGLCADFAGVVAAVAICAAMFG